MIIVTLAMFVQGHDRMLEHIVRHAAALRDTLRDALQQLEALSPEELIEQRYAKFRQMGNFFL